MTAPETESVTAWRLGKIESSLDVIVGKLDDRPDWKDVRAIEGGLLERVKKLEEWQTWALRLGAPALIATGAGMLVNAFKLT